MKDFEETRAIEKESEQRLERYGVLQSLFPGGHKPWGRLLDHRLVSKERHAITPDYRVMWRGEEVGLEVKAEQLTSRNVFAETWSHKKNGKGYTRGWIHTNSCELVLWHFLEDDRMVLFRKAWLVYLADAPGLREVRVWDSYPNETWGKPVPITRLHGCDPGTTKFYTLMDGELLRIETDSKEYREWPALKRRERKDVAKVQ